MKCKTVTYLLELELELLELELELVSLELELLDCGVD
jgi:hypothetical protein